jgi:ferredoxin-NADP reductase
MYSGADDKFLDFLIRKVEGGGVSSELQSLEPGDFVEIGGPYGEFCLDESKVDKSKFLFIASGTGIAPFHSFVMSFPKFEYEILHGVRFEEEAYDRIDYPALRYTAAVSQPKSALKGQRVTDLLEARNFDPNEIVYLCGNRSMIIDCVELLRSKGINGDSIFMETFF